MEITLKIIKKLEPQGGVARNGNEWNLQAYVGETLDQYPRKVHFEVFGAEKISNNNCEVDDKVTVSYDLESREYNGRWYTSVRAYRIVPSDGEQQKQEQKEHAAPASESVQPTQQTQQMTFQPEPEPQSEISASGSVDDSGADLPF